MLSSAVGHLCRQCRCQLIRLPVRYPHAVLTSPAWADGELHSWLLNTPVRFAGHSHWQNVKKTKLVKDDQRQRVIQQTVQRIRLAIRGWCCSCLMNAIYVQFFVHWHLIGWNHVCQGRVTFILNFSFNFECILTYNDRDVTHLHIKWGVALGPIVVGAGTRHLPPSPIHAL